MKAEQTHVSILEEGSEVKTSDTQPDLRDVSSHEAPFLNRITIILYLEEKGTVVLELESWIVAQGWSINMDDVTLSKEVPGALDECAAYQVEEGVRKRFGNQGTSSAKKLFPFNHNVIIER